MATHETSATFLSIEDFKAMFSATSVAIKRNTETNKLYALTNNSIIFKVQQDIDPAKPMKYMIPEGTEEKDGCIVNVTESETLFEL